VIRIRPGRSWRHNPDYLRELRAGTSGADILDVLGIEVDGVDIAAGVGEGRVLVAVAELAQALRHIAEGEPAAEATIGPGPTELVLEARGPDLLLTLVSLAPPARIVAGGLLVDAARMRAATLHAARGLLLDLFSINPGLEETPPAKQLGEVCAHLSRRPEKAAPQWPAREASWVSTRAGARPSLELSLTPEAHARLRSRREVPHAPLAPHLATGRLALRRHGAPGLVCEGPVLLLLRNLLADAQALAEAWEAGDRSFTVHFGPHELRCDPATDELRAPGWRHPLRVPALRFAALIAEGALGYVALAGRGPANHYLADLRDTAHRLLGHCHDVESGDLRRAPETVAAPPARVPPARQGPLAQGRMRRLVYREAWRAPVRALRALSVGPLVLELPESLEARDPESGKKLWSVSALPGAAARGGDLFYAEPGDALVRLDVQSGEPRWKRRIRGAGHPARVWPLESGVLRALPGEGLALVKDGGALGFRVELPGGAPVAAALVEGVLVVALASGSIAGLDPAEGSVLWKRRFRASAILPFGTRALLFREGVVACLEAGKIVWERELPWVRELSLSDDLETLIATGDGGAAARLDEKCAALWSLPAEGDAPAAPALLQREVVLLQRGPISLHDAAQGLPLAQLPAARAAALGADLSVTLLHESEVSMHRLATHLSVVTT
jgi:hypothetical protein